MDDFGAPVICTLMSATSILCLVLCAMVVGLWCVCIISEWLLMGGCTLCVMCSGLVVFSVCLAMLCGGECVCGCGLWAVQYVMGSGRVLIFPDRFVRGEFGEFSILGVG